MDNISEANLHICNAEAEPHKSMFIAILWLTWAFLSGLICSALVHFLNGNIIKYAEERNVIIVEC